MPPMRRISLRLALAILAATLVAPLCAAPPTTVVLVRHAEKGAGRDPGLNPKGGERARALARVLADLPITGLYASQFRRTRDTLAPLAATLDTEVTVAPLDAADLEGSIRGMAARILAEHPGGTVVVAGHSNTVPMLVEALGADGAPALEESDYDDLFVVTVHGDGAVLLHLHYGAVSP